VFGLKNPILVVALATAALLSFSPTPAKADIVYTLTNIPLSDGGLLNGTFAINQYGYIDNSVTDVTTTAGSILGAGSYTGIYNTLINNPSDTVVTFEGDTDPYGLSLVLTFKYNLATVGGIDPIIGGIGGPSYEDCAGYGGCGSSGIRYVGVSAVPETSTWAMMLIGFGLIGLQLRRRRSAEVTA